MKLIRKAYFCIVKMIYLVSLTLRNQIQLLNQLNNIASLKIHFYACFKS